MKVPRGKFFASGRGRLLRSRPSHALAQRRPFLLAAEIRLAFVYLVRRSDYTSAGKN
jgi:hypothetical protein